MGLLLTAAGDAAATVARMRGARPMHPRGRTYRGDLLVLGGADTGLALLDRAGRHPALIRLSKGVPTPRGWPDVMGLAARIDVDGGHLDLLLSSAAGRVPLLRQAFFPRLRPSTFYSSLTGYRTARGRLYFGAWGGLGPPDTYMLAVASRFGRWRPVGPLRAVEPLGPEVDARLAFDPEQDLPGLRADSRMQHLRGVVYRSAQRERLGRLPALRAG